MNRHEARGPSRLLPLLFSWGYDRGVTLGASKSRLSFSREQQWSILFYFRKIFHQSEETAASIWLCVFFVCVLCVGSWVGLTSAVLCGLAGWIGDLAMHVVLGSAGNTVGAIRCRTVL